MTTTHATTVTLVGCCDEPTRGLVAAQGAAGDNAYRIDCSVCGHVATYAGEQFTLVEARRHEDYFATLDHRGRQRLPQHVLQARARRLMEG